MEKRILLEKRGRVANQIKELNLDNCRSNFIDGLTDEFTALEKLSLINVSLTTLKNFPKLPSLKKLELSDNRISNALSNLLTSPKLISLNLSGNKIKDFDELKPLASLEKLEILDLFNNEVTMAENYRGNVFKLLPSLKYLDGFDPAENEAPSDEDDEVNGVDSDDDDDDEGLADVYNDDLEELEDNSDYDEEREEDEDVDEDSDDDADETAEKIEGAEGEAEAESPARGKKRKHDGEGEGEGEA
ncbi:unnamed protein product [Diamesa serratosioi]